MARIFITGSADGLGQLAAMQLIKSGHEVVMHARNEERAKHALHKVPDAALILTGDLSSIEETKNLAIKVNASGRFDAIIHNAGVYRVPINTTTVDGLPLLFAVNSLAPYVLTCLIQKPGRLIYMSSGMHLQGNAAAGNFNDKRIHVTYADTKLHNVMLAMAVARKWNNVYANAVDPGWVPTKMGGAGAPGNLEKGFETQVWLAVSNDAQAKVSGCYFHHKKQEHYLPVAANAAAQEKLLALCAGLTGVTLDNSGC